MLATLTSASTSSEKMQKLAQKYEMELEERLSMQLLRWALPRWCSYLLWHWPSQFWSYQGLQFGRPSQYKLPDRLLFFSGFLGKFPGT